jgi:hypothetical protein
VDHEIMEAQRCICEFLDLDFSALWQWSDEAPGFFTLTPSTVPREVRILPILQPRNIPELRDVIEHSTIITAGETLRVPMLDHAAPEALPVRTRADPEHEHIMKALEKTGWRIKGARGASTLLGLNPSILYGRMRKLGVPTHRRKDDA